MSQTSCDGGKILEKQVVLKKQQVEEYFTAKSKIFRQIKILNSFFENTGFHILGTKEKQDYPARYQHSVPKPTSLMVWKYISVCRMGRLHVWKGAINAERYTQALKHHMRLCALHLLQQRCFIVEESELTCQQSRLFPSSKHHETKNTKKTQDH